MRFRFFRGRGCRDNCGRCISEIEFPVENAVNVTQMKKGESAKIIAILGHPKPVSRLNAMGIIPGTCIVKKSSSAMRGPVVLEKNGRQLAIGFRMAENIIVEPAAGFSEQKGESL